ncbi:MAG: hypothetical protein V2A56_01635 [bacterium]
MLSQHLSGTLLREPCTVSEQDLKIIHGLANPPLLPLSASEIYVRRCRLASDQIDSRYGRFRTENLPRLLELVQGAPVLIGHDRRTLGIARFFGGDVEKRDDISWIVPRFYWPRVHSQADDLRVMIDAGVYNEASIAFVYRAPICSICEQDLRGCPHWPGRTYDGQLCFFWYDGIERVTEGSLVYRGAAPGTGIELACDHATAKDEKENGIDDDGTERKLLIKHRGIRYSALLAPIRSVQPVTQKTCISNKNGK